MDPSEDVSSPPSVDALSAISASENATNRRRSGRERKRPVVYSPPPITSQNGANGKRKRVNEEGVDEDVDSSASDENSEEVEESDDDVDEEEVKAKKRRATAARKAHSKRAVKKPKTKGAVGAKTLAVRSAPRRPPPQQRATPVEEEEEDAIDPNSLYAEVFSTHSNAPDAVAAEWLSRYERNNADAIRDLINLVLRATGCKFEVTTIDIEDQDNITGKLSDLQDEYQAQKITDYPLIRRTRSQPPFRQTLLAFFDSLVSAMHASSALYHDPALMENIQAWITTMSSSASRPFRHTASVISLSFVSTLCDVALGIAESTAKTLRQLEGEKKKSRVNAGRVSSLEEKLEQGSQKREIVDSTIRDIFDTVFVHRYRDVDPRIRAECIQSLGHWILTMPDIFFEGKYLRYLGWILSDTSAPTRLEVIKQLQRLFKKTTNISGLHTFTERFRPRLVEMAIRDADSNVRASTVELLEQLRAAQLLEPDDMDEVTDLVFDSDPKVRKALVPFFTEHVESLYEGKLEELGGEDLLDSALAREDDSDYDHPRLAWLKLNCLAQLLFYSDADKRKNPPAQIKRGPIGSNDVLIAAGAQSRISLAAETLCEHFSELKEWEVLAGYLLYDHTRSSRKTNDIEVRFKDECIPEEAFEIILLEVLYAAVKHNLKEGGETDLFKKSKSKRSHKMESVEDQENIARHLAELIPRFLNKYGARPATASAVLKLGRLLNLDIFQQLRQDSTTYASLLDEINKQFLTHGEQSVLAEASAALLHAKSFEELEEVTEEKVHYLWEDTVNTLEALIKGRNLDGKALVQNAVLNGLVGTVRRISNLASISNCIEILESTPGQAGRKQRRQDADTTTLLQTLMHLLTRSIIEKGPKQAEDGNEELENELAVCAMKAIFLYFMWKVRALKQALMDGGKQASQQEITTLIERRQVFGSALIGIIQSRSGMDELRLAAAGMFLDLHTLFSTFRQLTPPIVNLPREYADADAFFSKVTREIPYPHQAAIMSLYAAVEKIYAKKSRRSLEVGDDDEPLDSDDESEPEEEEEDADAADAAERARHEQALICEQRFCELVGKVVLAIIAKVFDASGPQRGQTRDRLERNRTRLGQNYKEVVAYLEEPKPKKTKNKITATETGKQASSKEIGNEVTVEDDGIEDESMDEGGELDLRDKELTAEDHEIESADEGDEGAGGMEPADEIEDDIMGD